MKVPKDMELTLRHEDILILDDKHFNTNNVRLYKTAHIDMKTVMKSEKQIRDHIKLLDKAIDFMKNNKEKGANDEWIKRWQIYSEILKWVVGDQSEYEDVYKNIESLRKKATEMKK